jgi:hypothetical protein
VTGPRWAPARFNFWEFWLNPRCTECGQRTPLIEVHWQVEHAGDEWIAR